MRTLFNSTSEILKNIRRIWSLAVFQSQSSNKEMFFGGLWKIISPFIQTGIYWLVFGIGLRSGAPIDGIPYVVWLTCGLTPWYMISKAVGVGASSIYNKATVLSRSNISTILIPVSNVMSVMLDSIWSFVLLIVIYIGNKCSLNFYALNLIYYVVYAFLFLTNLSLITSVLVMLARDFKRVIELLMRFMFFRSPIFWNPSRNMPEYFLIFNKYSPFSYIINGFRDSLLYCKNFYDDIYSMLYFIGVLAITYVIGVFFQGKLRKNLLDFV